MQDLSPRPGDLEPIETASVDELRALQLDRLKWSVRHAYKKVPHYRKAFDEAGVHPDDVKSPDDIANLPFTTKSDLRENYPFGMFAVPRDEMVRVHASSGTTGRPTVVGYTRDNLDNWATVMARSIRAAGGRAGHTLHNAYGYGRFTGGLGAHAGAERLGCMVVPVSGGMTERQVQLIQDFRPDVIIVTPSYMLSIIDEMERQGVDPRSTSLKVGILGAEPWTNDMRHEIEQRVDMHAVDIYGLSEVADFLPQHHEHRQQILQIISAAEARGQQRLSEMNRQVLGNLDRIIGALEDDDSHNDQGRSDES